jgi:hypothetical protein
MVISSGKWYFIQLHNLVIVVRARRVVVLYEMSETKYFYHRVRITIHDACTRWQFRLHIKLCMRGGSGLVGQ